MFEQRLDAIRQSLPAVLADSLSKTDTSQFMVYWEAGVAELQDQHDEVKSFFRELLTFTQQLNRQFELEALTRSRVRQSTLEAFLGSAGGGASTATPGPRPAAAPPPQAAPAAAGTKLPPQHHVFNALLSALISRFDSRFGRAGSLKLEFAARLPELKADGAAQSMMRRWASSEHFSGDFSRISEPDMRSVLDLVYTLMCDEFGPVDSDAMLSDAAGSVENSRESRLYSVRNLL